MIVVFSVSLGILYPLAVWAVGQALFPHQANGSLIEKDGRVVGSDRPLRRLHIFIRVHRRRGTAMTPELRAVRISGQQAKN